MDGLLVCVCVKVILANSKRQGSVRDQHEDEKMMRLFIMIPQSYSEKDVEDEFSVCVIMMMMMMMMMMTTTTRRGRGQGR